MLKNFRYRYFSLKSITAYILLCLISACTQPEELIFKNDLEFHVNFVSGYVNKHPRYTHKAYEYIAPASCQKIITAMAAYKALTPDYRFETTLKATYQNSTIKTLILKGSGDPTLTFDDLNKLFAAIKDRIIDGSLVVDVSAFQTPEWCPSWMESDKGTSYAAPLSGLMIDKNYFHFSITSKAVGRSVSIDGIDSSLIQNNLRVDDQKNTHLEIYWKKDKLVLDGSIAPNQSIKKKISPLRSEVILRYRIKQVLQHNNITAKKGIVFINDKKTSKALDTNSQTIQRHVSEPLLSILTPLIKQSDNLIADSLYLKIAHLFNPDCRHWEDGRTIIPNIIKQYYDINLGRAVIRDGSGLSRHNRIQPIMMWHLLNKFIQYNELVELLPAPCEQKTTLACRLTSLPLKAKTGTMSNVNGLAGFYLSKNTLPQVFFLMISNFIAPVNDIFKEQEQLLHRYLAD